MIIAQNIQKSFGPLKVLKGINLEVNKGEIISIVGASGAGKSTLLHIMGLLDHPTEGQVLLDGKNVAKLSDIEISGLRGKTIGFVFQAYHLIAHMNMVENVALTLFYQGVSGAERRQKAGVAPSKKWKHTRSGGEQLGGESSLTFPRHTASTSAPVWWPAQPVRRGRRRGGPAPA